MSEDWSTDLQKKVYTTWANNILNKRNLTVTDMIEEFVDGVLLINLLEALTNNSITHIVRPKNRFQQLSNVQLALTFVENWGINLVNYRPENLVDKHTKMTLALVWRIITKFHIHQFLGDEDFDPQGGDMIESEPASLSLSSKRTSSNVDIYKSARGILLTPREALLRWCRRELDAYQLNPPVTNFTKSFQNPQVFIALVHKQAPTHVDLDEIAKMDDVAALRKCFEVAEKHLGIPQLLSAQMVVDGLLDESCTMTYVAYFLNYQKVPPIHTSNNGANFNRGHTRNSSTGSNTSNSSSNNQTNQQQINQQTNPQQQQQNNQLNSSSDRHIKRSNNKVLNNTPDKYQQPLTPISSPITHDRHPHHSHQTQTSPNSSNSNSKSNNSLTTEKLTEILNNFTSELRRITLEHEEMLNRTAAKLDERVNRLGDKLDQLESKISVIKNVVIQNTTTSRDVLEEREQNQSIDYDEHNNSTDHNQTTLINSPTQQLLTQILSSTTQMLSTPPSPSSINNDNSNSSTPQSTTSTTTNNSNNSTTTTSTSHQSKKSSSSSSSSSTKKKETKEEREERREKRRSRRKEREEKKNSKNNATMTLSSSSCSLADDAQVDRDELKKIIRVQAMVRGHLARRAYKRIKNRRDVALEILNTEKTYLHNLHILLHDYLSPLRKMSETMSSINPDNVKTLYNNIEVILNINNSLLKRLQERMSTPWHYEQLFGDIFFKMCDLLKCYIAYVNHYNRSLSTINDFTKQSSLNEFMNTTFMRTNLQLRDLIIIPVQRIPRYVLLLEEMVKVTSASHPDRVQLVGSLTKMQSIADHVNEKRRDFENVLHVSLLQDAIIGFNIMDYASLRYMMEGDLQFHMASSGSGFGTTIAGVVSNAVTGNSSDLKQGPSVLTNLHVFLFNQMLVVCKYKKGKESYFSKFGSQSSSSGHLSNDGRKSKQPKYKFIFNHNLTSETKLSHNKSDSWFGVDNTTEYRRFIAKTVAEKDMWIQHITSCITKATENKISKDKIK